MKIFNNSTTNLILVALTLALITLTFLKVVEAKDFMVVVMMVLGYKFAKSQVSPVL